MITLIAFYTLLAIGAFVLVAMIKPSLNRVKLGVRVFVIYLLLATSTVLWIHYVVYFLEGM